MITITFPLQRLCMLPLNTLTFGFWFVVITPGPITSNNLVYKDITLLLVIHQML